MINILIRTSKRPKCFKNCIESIKAQNYQSINIIVGSDSRNEYLKQDYGIKFTVVKYRRQKQREEFINTARHFPYNLYFNKLYEHCKDGYIIFLDDDDILNSPQALYRISKYTSNDSNIILFKTMLDNRVVPSLGNWGKMPVCKDFSSLNIAFHTKYIPYAKWSEYKQGDYRLAWNLWGVIPHKQFIDNVLTRSQKGEGAGMREDTTKVRKMNTKPKIIIMTPLWSRPEVFELFIKGFNKLQPTQVDLQLVCILSEEDKKINELKYLLKQHNIDYYYYPNKPLGRKMNAGLRIIYENYEFDYIMNLDSDGVINPKLFDFYLPYIHEGNKFFGVSTYYALNYATKECLRFTIDEICICSGRMIHRDIIERFTNRGHYIYDNRANDGMDALSSQKVIEEGFKETILDITEPMILDIKTNTNISHWDMIKKMSYTFDVDYEEIKEYFDYE